MANLGQLVYQLPKQGIGSNLSTLHSLSRQKKGASNRYGRAPSLVSQYHGEGVGNFAAAPMQNAASGGNVDLAPPPTPTPAPFAPPPSTPTVPSPGTDPSDMAEGFSIGKGEQGLNDMMGQQIGNDLAMSMAGRGVKGAAQTGTMATVAGAPTSVALDAMMQSGMFANMSLSGLKGVADALAKGYSANQIGPAITASGIVAPSTAVDPSDPATPPMGTVASNIAMSSLANSPQSAWGLISNAFSDDPSPQDITNDTISAAMTGLAHSPNIDVNSPDPVAKGLLNYNPNILRSMMEDHFSQPPPIDMPSTPTSVPGFDPMSIGFSDTPSQDDSGFTPMSLGQPQGLSDNQGFSPMGFGDPGDSSGDAEGISPMGLGPVGPAPGVAADGGDGGGDGTVICTELHRQGLMPDDIYKADADFGKSLDDDTIRGYHLWGKPVARAMRKSPLLTWLIKPLVLSWAHTMAGSGSSLFWSLALKMGMPVCRFIGRRNTNTELIYE